MGRTVADVCERTEGAEVAAGYDINPHADAKFPIYTGLEDVKEEIHVIVDFSHPSAFEGILDFAIKNKIPAVICTTGLGDEQKVKMKGASKSVPIFFSANMSIGINLLIDLASKAARLLESNFDIEIVEKHHNQKIDAPSGTALAIADAVSEAVGYDPKYTYDRHSVRRKREKTEIGIHSIRGGTIVGEHNVIFAGTDEVLELKHTATSKDVFAIGAIRAAMFMNGKAPGMYSMKDLIENA